MCGATIGEGQGAQMSCGKAEPILPVCVFHARYLTVNI